MIRLRIDAVTPSLNETQRWHWATQRNFAAETELRLMAAIWGMGLGKATGKRRVVIERHGKKQLDPDNLQGGCKILIDAMRRLGLLVNDDPQSIVLETKNVPLAKGEQPHTVIVLEDL